MRHLENSPAHLKLTRPNRDEQIFVKMHLSHKEIAPMPNTSVRCAETARYKARKRRKVQETNLVNFLESLSEPLPEKIGFRHGKLSVSSLNPLFTLKDRVKTIPYQWKFLYHFQSSFFYKVPHHFYTIHFAIAIGYCCKVN